MFKKRLIEPELLDHVPPEIARPNLADLVRINELFGGHSVIMRALRSALPEDGQFTLLDIGAASGDTARTIQTAYPGASVLSLDASESNLSAAPRPKLIANAFELPFGKASVDYVLCSLFLHHFPDEQVIALLKSFHAVARRALVVCDLERHILPYLFLSATRKIFRWNWITVHDGKISVRASFRVVELRELARRAGIGKAEVRAHRPAFRLSLIGHK